MKNTILFLSLNTFSNTGGIPQVCKNLTYALSKIAQRNQLEFRALALYDDDCDEKYLDKRHFKGYKKNKFNYLKDITLQQARAKFIVLSHVNLLAIIRLLQHINKETPIFLIAHGVEIWRKLSHWKVDLLKNRVCIWSVSNFTQHVIHRTHGIPLYRIHTLYNCLDPFFEIPDNFTKPTRLLEKYQISSDIILLTVSRMSSNDRLKGYDKVLNAMPYILKEIPRLHYVLCGQQDLEEKKRIDQLIHKLHLENHITITGFLNPKELTEHYLLADLFVLPSEKEGFGIAFIEAAACGCKVISGNSDGSKEALLNGLLGCMVDSNDSIDLQKTIIKSIEPRPESIKKMQQDTCIGHFGASVYEKRITELLKLKFNQ